MQAGAKVDNFHELIVESHKESADVAKKLNFNSNPEIGYQAKITKVDFDEGKVEEPKSKFDTAKLRYWKKMQVKRKTKSDLNRLAQEINNSAL
jgi:hypothetical protein